MFPHSRVIASVPCSAPPVGARGAGSELRLLEGALSSLAEAGDALQAGQAVQACDGLASALHCVTRFRANLDAWMERSRAAQLEDLCDYMLRQLAAARRQHEVAPVLEVTHLLHEMRAAWVTLRHV